MKPDLSTVEGEGLRIEPQSGIGELTVKLSGSCDSRTAPVLDRFLGKLHDEVVRVGMKRVIVDCENLYFMNSASVKAFVMWLAKVKALAAHDRYVVKVRTNRFVAWHQRSFSAISRSAPDVFTVET